MLEDIYLKTEYSSSKDNLIVDFYLPCLTNSVEYGRAVGYFSSAIYLLFNSSFEQFITNNGKIRIICSPQLTDEDAFAIKEGSSLKHILAEKLEKEMYNVNIEFDSLAPSSLLKQLVSAGVLEFKFAIPSNGTGIFHPKIGYFKDAMGNTVTFNGSINETFKAWEDNYEYFDVFTSYDTNNTYKTQQHKSQFEEIWNDMTKGIKIIDQSLVMEVFVPTTEDYTLEKCFEIIKADNTKKSISNPSSEVVLQDHQKRFIHNWNANNYSGTMGFITGGGKTYTSLNIIKSWLTEKGPCLILVPSQILFNQWVSEIDATINRSNLYWVPAGAGHSADTWHTILAGLTGKNSANLDKPLLVLATYQTAMQQNFFKYFKNMKNFLLVADEAHKIGAPGTSVIMDELEPLGRLALSATIERANDPEGTEKIIKFFGPVLEPAFGIEEAITAKRLVPYNYYVKYVYLDTDEQERFDKINQNIGIVLSNKDLDESEKNRKVVDLLIARAEITKECTSKDLEVLTILQNIDLKNEFWLVYCNSTKHLNRISELLRSNNIDSIKYHSSLVDESRVDNMHYFRNRKGVLLSINCLDEGVDIPELNGAIIISSSSNPRQYIQRRGRVLRSHPGKYSADIHDLLVLTNPSSGPAKPALMTEAKRSLLFSKHALNKSQLISLERDIEVWECMLINNNAALYKVEGLNDHEEIIN